MAAVPPDKETPPAAPVARRHVPAVVIWLLVVVIAAAAFAVAIIYAGGVPGVIDLLGTVVAGGKSGTTSPTPRVSMSTTGTASSEPTASTGLGGLPAEALRTMYTAQLESQPEIAALVQNRYSWLSIGAPEQSSDTATVPVTTHFRDGVTQRGVMTLRRFGSLWYFFSLAGSGSDEPTDTHGDVQFDAAVVRVMTSQQATKENQDALVAGVLHGGFTRVRITGVERGQGTASVNVRLSGGTAKARTGRFVCISKRDSSTDYWFIARLAAN